MAPTIKTAAAAAKLPPTDDSPSEHIYIGGDDFTADPATIAKTVKNKVRLNNPLRHMCAEITFFAEGVLKVATLRNGKQIESFFLDLRFLDPVPKIERTIATRWLYAALGCGATAALAAFLLRFDALYIAAAGALGLAALGSAVALYVGIYLSHERIEFFTMHGRASVLPLVANFGTLRKFHAFLPVLSRAIEEAAESIGADTSAYLRAEMREHYRLRGQDVLSPESCAAGTGRILAQFDVQL
ncbi:MAG TPA: hypothetical protein VIQ99_09915 [Gammaproteobacteria bacterium]